MNKLFVIGAFLLSLIAGQGLDAMGYNRGYGYNQRYAAQGYVGQGYVGQGYIGQGHDSDGSSAAPCEQPCNDCYCLYVRYEPCHYTTKRCVEECIPCKKKCYRMVPQYYEVQRCRYVPQYYTETCCRQVRECYEVDDVKTCKKVIREPQVKYVPKYYWKHTSAPTCQ